MSATSTRPAVRSWLAQLISGRPHQIIGGVDDPYLLRWYVIPRNRFINVYVHKFLRSDDDRALHDHPWWFVSLLLRGEYGEVTGRGTIRRRAGSIAFRPADWRHRVELDWEHPVCDDGRRRWRERPAWTLIVTGPRVRGWGFWCPGERFVPWRQWGAAGCGETS